MISPKKLLLIFALQIVSLNLLAQKNADIGFRFTTSDYNKLLLEFRKPINKNYSIRLGLSTGANSFYPRREIIAANDTIITTISNQSRYYDDFRFGFERKLPMNFFSVHADLILGYQRTYLHNENFYYVKDSLGVWQRESDTAFSGNSSSAYKHYISTGLSIGMSFDYPLSKRFILCLNANYTGFLRFQFSETETNDFLNEFDSGNEILLNLYGTLGVGLRYVFGKKEKKEE